MRVAADDVSHKRRYALVGVFVVPVDAMGKPVLGEDQEQASGDGKDACMPEVDHELEELEKDIEEWFGGLADDASALQVGPEAPLASENFDDEASLKGEGLEAPEGLSPEVAQGKKQSDCEKGG